LAFSPNGAIAYVVNSGSGSVSPITVSTGVVGAAIAVGSTPRNVAVTPDGATLYVSNFGSNSVSVITTSTSAVTAVSVGAGPSGIGLSPDGTMAYVTNFTDGTVSPITVAGNAVGTAIAVGGGPSGVAFTPDSTTAYVTNSTANTYTPITVATGAAASAVAAAGAPSAMAIVPAQSPTAVLASVTGGAVGDLISFDATGSSNPVAAIVSYAWNFGDGTPATSTSVATTTHAYSVDGSYTAFVVVTDANGTNNTVVFTGQTASRNGSALAKASRSVVIATAFGWVTPPAAFSFSGTMPVAAAGLNTTLPLDVINGSASGWSISATSTLWSTAGGVRSLPASSTSITAAPAVTCDASSACALASNAITYPYVLPAGLTAPTATKLFNAAANSGTGKQTLVPTLSLAVPANSYVGSYSTTVTLSLASGP
jgi:YVTN family beta-propeller protein